MRTCVLLCGRRFDGVCERLTSPVEIRVDYHRIVEIAPLVRRPPGTQTIDLSERTVSPWLIDAHVHLTTDAADNLFRQILEVSSRDLN